MDFNLMFGRALRAARLDVTLYNEVEADASLNREALYVVIIVSVLSGIGSFLSLLFSGSIIGALLSLIVGIAFGILAYYLFCYVAHWVGTSMFKGQGDVGEVLRTVGYASGVRAIGLLAFIPCIGWLIGLAGLVWWIAASVVALREALDIDTGNAIVTAVIGGVIVVAIYAAIAAVMAILGFGVASLGGLLN
ncbi:MAG: YIP1 family protein [Anaerolineae bacterium]|nr:YIP1 family protein [Anaerolineae bacterium]MCB0246762.1 YIP1 family protein [Anaerolineae bacterium]MCB0251151.1 YIP1 family protein [Anaerolineae bacterium]MCB9131948.1 YIP1 family protein [Anaerolineales bacterium]MCB9142014.1 YIP1 family protein [Anaerolineales bacterium]